MPGQGDDVLVGISPVGKELAFPRTSISDTTRSPMNPGTNLDKPLLVSL